MSHRVDITGRRFERLVALRSAGSTPRGQLLWLCQCDCGQTAVVAGSKLRNGHTKSCGCIKEVGGNAFMEDAIASSTDECLMWPFGRRVRGYGVLAVGRKPMLVHRMVCERVHGPSKLLAIHSCDNPPCINPRHLRWGTQSDNMYDMWNRGRH